MLSKLWILDAQTLQEGFSVCAAGSEPRERQQGELSGACKRTGWSRSGRLSPRADFASEALALRLLPRHQEEQVWGLGRAFPLPDSC